MDGLSPGQTLILQAPLDTIPVHILGGPTFGFCISCVALSAIVFRDTLLLMMHTPPLLFSPSCSRVFALDLSNPFFAGSHLPVSLRSIDSNANSVVDHRADPAQQLPVDRRYCRRAAHETMTLERERERERESCLLASPE